MFDEAQAQSDDKTPLEGKLECRARSLANLRPARKGEVRNPSGRSRKDKTLARIAQEHADAAIQTLVDVMADRNASPSARVSAASEILDRGFGRAPQSIALDATMTLSQEFEALVRSLNAGAGAKVIESMPDNVTGQARRTGAPRC